MARAALAPFATTPRQLLESVGIHSRPLIVLCTAIVLAGALATALFAIHRLLKVFGRRLSVRRRAERRRLLRRRLFASFLESRVRDLDNKEEWSDQRFAELEAEVETIGVREGRRSLGPFGRGGGLRRERSLSRALVRSKEKLILLQGDPGSGKSVALRFVARRMAERAMRARTLDSVMPLYLNLKSLKPEGRPVDAKLIESYVLETLQAGSRDIHRFLREEFEPGKEKGTWFFLFDSFDEIPDVLSATEVTDTVRAYSDAIYGFLHGLNKCRGVIASRHFRAPPRWGLPTFRVVPLSERRKRDLVHKADLGEPVESQLLTELPAASADVVALSSNPLFLGLLVEYAHREKRLPGGWHDVFEAFVSHRLETDDRKVAEVFGIGAEELRTRSEELAFTMTATEGLGLSPTRDALEDAYVKEGFAEVDRLGVALDALEWIKLGRSESADRSSHPTFSFAHRRFQEYFATCVVLREPDRVSPRRLLTDASWRETTVTLCHAYTDKTEGILIEAEALLGEAVAAAQAGAPEHFTWPPGALHLLSLLQSAFAGRTEALPEGIHRRVGEIFQAVDARGTIVDRKWVLEVAGIARPNDLAERLGVAFRDGSEWLREAAYRQTARLASVSEGLAAEIRVALVERTADRRLLRDWPATRAQLMRLDSSPRLMRVARLLRAMPFVDSTAVLAGLIAMLVVEQVPPARAVACGLMAGLFAAAYFPAAKQLARSRFKKEPMDKDGRLIPAEVATSLALLVRVFGPPSAVLALVPGGSFLSSVLVIVFTYAFTWSIAATYACVYGPPRRRLGWLAVHLSPLRRRYKSLRGVFSAVLDFFAAFRDPSILVVLLFGAAYLASLVLLPEPLPTIELTLTVLAFVAAISFLVIRWLQRAIPDALWRRRWRDDVAEEVQPRDILDALVELQQASTVAWYLEQVRTRRLLSDSDEARAILRDVLRVLDLGEGWSFAPRSRGFVEWYDADEKQASFALRRIHEEGVPDELGRLLEELERRQELPVA